jgi:hypothetical protein
MADTSAEMTGDALAILALLAIVALFLAQRIPSTQPARSEP